MRRVSNVLTLIRSLGGLGLILVLGVAVLAWSVLNVVSLNGASRQLYEVTQIRDQISTIRGDLFDMELAESYFVLYGDAERLDRVEASASDLDEAIAYLQEHAASSSEKTGAILDQLQGAKDSYMQTFADLQAAADTGDWDQVASLRLAAAGQTEAMLVQVDDLLFEAETALQEGSQVVTDQSRWAILAGIVGLIAMPLLGIWAFVLAGRLTQPIPALTNAVVAIAGNQFRPELLSDVAERRDGLGQLARAVEHLAQETRAREDALGQEEAQLREQLHEARRRKLFYATAQRAGPES